MDDVPQTMEDLSQTGSGPTRERDARVLAGVPAFVALTAIAAIGVVLVVLATSGGSGVEQIGGIVVLALAAFGCAGLFVVQPNDARVLVLFGSYIGTVTRSGWWWCFPLTTRERISRRVCNFQTEKIKVNDARGNPIEIGAVVVWRVADTARAVFDVADYDQFVVVQSETSLRHLANAYPYDDNDAGALSLRTHTDDVRTSLESELQARLRLAGITILETRLTHLAYAPEIAEVMLRRQQAEAILSARSTMVKGAVGLVQMALAQLADSDLVELDPERKAAMVSSLMVVLSGDHSPAPVINTGTLYS